MDEVKAVKSSREKEFANFVIARVETDKAFGAALRRADNPDTEYQAWEYLSRWCEIEKDWERQPYALIAAALARAKPAADGHLGIGRALAGCYDDGNNADSAKGKLRRLLACDNCEEACAVLRPLLSLIGSKNVRLNYGQLLADLVYFGDGERKKLKWAADFYGRREDAGVSA